MTSDVQVLIAVPDPVLRGIWESVFKDVTGVNILDADFRGLCSMPVLDAVLMLGAFAHERYGGHPRRGESSVLDTGGEPGMPMLVVTIAGLPAQFEQREEPDGGEPAN